MNSDLLIAAEQYARNILENELPDGYVYHNLDHTQQVVQLVEKIGHHSKLSGEEIELLKIAAWLHDLGYLHTYVDHEEKSSEMARAFLSTQGVEPKLMKKVTDLIYATRIDHEPNTFLEQVIRDADLSNLGTPDALESSELIRQEWKTFSDRDFTDEEWNQFNYDFFSNHDYHTAYAQEFLGPLKQQAQRRLKKRVKVKKKQKAAAKQAMLEMKLEETEVQLDKAKSRLKKMKKLRPDRGIETMFRTTYRTHINLSSIADNKANILLSINAIVLSIIFTKVMDKFEDFDNYVIIPGLIIILVCMTTIVFAILATRPKVNSGIFTREDILNKKTNLLFFGNFHSMNLGDYLWGIDQMMKDAEYLYGSMTTDIYFLGKVLAKKFQLLRIAYNIFMYGMGLAVISFIVAFLLAYWGGTA
ncbi:MAG: Pycsar system effector family protein [Bacteroidota bacterium]